MNLTLVENKKLRVAIVGGGIGGLCLAIALNRSGHSVTIFERYAEAKAVGAGMTLWPNATGILHELGVLDKILPVSRPLHRLEVRHFSGRHFMTIPTEQFLTPAIAVHRADLHQALLAKINPAQIRLNHFCRSVTEDSAGAYLHFDSFKSEAFDIVVGADGIHSEIRRYVQSHRSLDYQGYVVWRGVACELENIIPYGTFTETWGRGHRFGILPMGRGQICWYATANEKQKANPRFKRNDLLAMFANWHAPIAQILRHTPEETIIRNEALDCKSSAGWSRGRVVLMGDSVHPTAPNLGQGGCMAIEDAIALSQLLNQPQPLAHAFKIYERSRRARVAGVTRRSRLIGQIGQWQNPLAVVVRDIVCQLIPGTTFTRTSRPLHSYCATDAVLLK